MTENVKHVEVLHFIRNTTPPGQERSALGAAIAALQREAAGDGEGCTSCDGTGELHRADGEYMGKCPCATPASAEPGEQGCGKCTMFDFFNGRACEPCLRTVFSPIPSDARGGGDALTKLKALAEEWRIQAFELGTGHDMCANRNTMCRFIALIDQLHPTPAALDAARATLLLVIAEEKSEWTGDLRTAAHKALDDLLAKFDAARATTGGNGNG